MDDKQQWKVITDYSRYQVSEYGIIWDCELNRRMPTVWNGNFLCTNLFNDVGVKVLCKIHRIVATEFVENPENAYKVIHIYGDRSNNHHTNLFWNPKRKKDVKEIVEEKYLYLNKEYTLAQLVHLSGKTKKEIKSKLKSGWHVREVVQGFRDFTGEGFQTDTHWFPNKR